MYILIKYIISILSIYDKSIKNNYILINNNDKLNVKINITEYVNVELDFFDKEYIKFNELIKLNDISYNNYLLEIINEYNSKV
jgi:hypothetical protein